MKVSVSIDSEEYEIREVDPNDSWDTGEQGLRILGVTAERTTKDYGWDLPDGTANAVVLVGHYSDGCTFGSSEYADVKGVFEHQADAEKFAATQSTDHGYFGNHIGWLYFDVSV